MKREYLVNRYSLFIYNTNYESIKIFKNNIGTTLAYPKPKKNNLVFHPYNGNSAAINPDWIRVYTPLATDGNIIPADS